MCVQRLVSADLNEALPFSALRTQGRDFHSSVIFYRSLNRSLTRTDTSHPPTLSSSPSHCKISVYALCVLSIHRRNLIYCYISQLIYHQLCVLSMINYHMIHNMYHNIQKYKPLQAKQTCCINKLLLHVSAKINYFNWK